MTSHLAKLFCSTVAMLALNTVGLADVVTLTDGSRIVGQLEHRTSETVSWTTDFAGTIEIDTDLIVALESADAVNPPTDDATPDDHTEKAHPLSLTSVDTSEASVAVTPTDKTAATAAAAGKTQDAMAGQGQADKVKWSAKLEANAILKNGNSETLKTGGKLQLKREDDRRVLSLFVSGDYEEARDQPYTTEAESGAAYERRLADGFFGYVRSTLKHDKDSNLDWRSDTRVGGGYYWLRKPDHELKNRLGLGYEHDNPLVGLDTDKLQVDIGLDYRVGLGHQCELLHQATYYPSIDQFDDYRLTFDTAVVFPLAKNGMCKLKIGALYEYDAVVEPTQDRLDRKHYANIVVDLK